MDKVFSVTKQIKFSAAHRLLNYDGDCNNVHGHNYTVELTFKSAQLSDETSMVVDFKAIKEGIGIEIMDAWDHALLINPHDKFLARFADSQNIKLFIFPLGDPTAENMCQVISCWCDTKYSNLGKVKIWETDSSYAELDLGGDDDA